MGGLFTKLFSKLSGKKELKIIIIGLDNSGKTTILSTILPKPRQAALKRNQVDSSKYISTKSAIGFNM